MASCYARLPQHGRGKAHANTPLLRPKLLMHVDGCCTGPGPALRPGIYGLLMRAVPKYLNGHRQTP